LPEPEPATTRLAALYDEAAPAAFGFLLRMVRERAWAEDLLHEAFVRVLPRLAELPDGESARRYLWRTAANLALDGLRRRRRFPASDLAASREPLDPGAPDGLEAAEQSEEHALLLRAVQALPARERVAVLLRVTARLTFKQMGEAMGLTDRGAAGLYEAAVDRLKRTIWRTDDALRP
jgi:RNA polymerase sigma-70 factor (ECF subfamily)